jgi:gliding motility-associated-like protein
MNHFLHCLSWLLLLCCGLAPAGPAHAQLAPTYSWVSTGGGPGIDVGDWIALDAAGNAYVAGSFEQTVMFGSSTLISQGGADVFLAKFDPQGQLLWVHSAGGPGQEEVHGLVVDAAGNACIVGYFGVAVTSTGPLPAHMMRVGPLTLTGGTGYSEMYVAKFDTQGDVQWARGTVGTAVSGATNLTLDRNGNVYVTGKTDKQTRFEGQYPVFGSGTSNGTFVAKYDAQGTLRWVKTGFGLNDNYSEQLAADASGQLYVVSYDQQRLPGGPSFYETRLSKLDANGERLWQQVLTNPDGSNTLIGERLLLDAQGNLVLGCEFNGTFRSGNQTFTAQNLYDVLLLRLTPKGEFLWAKQLAGNKPTYPNYIAGLALDAYGNLYTSVTLPDTGTPPPPNHYVGTTLLSFLPDGTLRWERPGPAVVANLAVTPRGDVLLTGQHDIAETFDGQPLAFAFAGYVDAYVARLAGPELPDVPPLPNVITPNGDGLNDAFRLPALPAGAWQLRVFSRWGTEVYHATDYQQDWTASGVPAGLYYYQLTASGQPALRGWLEVAR